MADKYLKVNHRSYIYKRDVTESEMNLFKTHRFASSYYFKTVGNTIKFYVQNSSTCSTSAYSKYNRHNNNYIFPPTKSSNKFVDTKSK